MAGAVPVSNMKQLVMHALVNNSAIASVVQGRVYGEFPDLTDRQDTEFPLIAMSFRSGRLNYSGGVRDAVFEVWCVSRVSGGEATSLYDKVVTALQAELLSITGLGTKAYCQETQTPVDAYDSVTRSWASQGRWVIRAIGT